MDHCRSEGESERIEIALFGDKNEEPVLAAEHEVDNSAHIERNARLPISVQNIASLHRSNSGEALGDMSRPQDLSDIGHEEP